jgi:hypothetical protein
LVGSKYKERGWIQELTKATLIIFSLKIQIHHQNSGILNKWLHYVFLHSMADSTNSTIISSTLVQIKGFHHRI